jgi:ATP-dependent Clp protease ATP-binding subunit ClpC
MVHGQRAYPPEFRHNDEVFERFTDRARRAVVLSQEEARLANSDSIGTEHVLLGLLRAEDITQQLLADLGMDVDTMRAVIAARSGPGNGPGPEDHIPFTPEAKKGLELSLREALDIGEKFIGTEHLLLGLLREGQGLAAQLLRERGAEIDAVRQEIRRTPTEVRRRQGSARGEDPPGFGEE